MALRRQKPPRTHSEVGPSDAGARNGRIAFQKYHKTGTHQHDSQLPQGKTLGANFVLKPLLILSLAWS